MSASAEKSSLAVAATGILGDLTKTIFSVDHWRRVFVASVIPFVVSALWHSSRTIIEVTDDEQSQWIRMWLSEQKRSIRRVRRLVLLPPSAKRGRHRADGRRNPQDAQDDDEREGGRFAPPKLEFQPANGVNAWTHIGMFPVSVSSNRGKGDRDPYTGGMKQPGYSITVWFASPTYGTSVARSLLLQGRGLLLAKRAKKTEIWMSNPHGGSKIITRPSRPLSSVIVEGNTKEMLRLDAMRFLDSEKWYVGKGIPYRRGYLLYGPPGCGKTSLIYALAGDLRLQIVVVSLNDNEMTDRRLMSALSEAPRDSIILVEDIDCALPRDDAGKSAQMMMRQHGRMAVTFAGLLNAIDGVGAQEGRLLFMTTNHLERLDKALIRPGRVDVKCHLDKASKQAAAELFDQFFVSSSSLGQEFSHEVLTEARSVFLSQIEDGAHSFASLQGVLMTARDDPLLVGEGMQKLLSTVDDAAVLKGESPWAIMSALKKETQDALAEEKRDEKAQVEAGVPVLKRLIGSPKSARQNVEKRWVSFGGFSTFGAPGMFVSSGVVYYEIEIISNYGPPQFGFSNKDGLPLSDEDSGEGTGDNETSWAVDGSRKLKWHGGDDKKKAWNSQWKEGTVVGLAANVDKGMIAVSKDGVWDKGKDNTGKDNEVGVVFHDDKIKKGVFPSFTASRYKLQYSLSNKHFKYAPPPNSIWTAKGGNGSDDSGGKN